MDRSSHPDSLELADYLDGVRRRWWVIAVAGILGLAAAAAYTMFAPKTYTASASVFVTGSTGGQTQIVNGRTAGVIDLDTEAQIVKSASVAGLARHMLGSHLSATALAQSVTVTVPANSQVLQINCARHTRTGAARCAQDFAQAYLQDRSNNTRDLIDAQLAGLDQQVAALQQKITKLMARINSLPRGSGSRQTASTQLSLYENLITTLSSHVANLTAQSVNTTGGRIITGATAPSGPSSPRRSVYWPSGLAAGLLAGLIIVFWRDRSDRRVRGARELEMMLDLPVLVDLSGDQRRGRPTLAEARSRTGQTYAELAHSLVATLGQGNHVVLVAAATAGYGGSVTAANLAAALARTGTEVALVCADLRGSIAPGLCGVADGPGLAEVVLDRATVGDVEKRPPHVPRLWVITPGVEGERAADRLDRDVAEQLVGRLHAVTRYVIFEVAPGAYSADTYAFAELADAAVVAVEVARALRADVEETVRRLDKMGAAVLGAVLLPSMAKATMPAAAGGPAVEEVAVPRGGKRRAPAQPRPQAEAAGQHVEEPALEDDLVYPPRPSGDQVARWAGSGDEWESVTAARQWEARTHAATEAPAGDGSENTSTRG